MYSKLKIYLVSTFLQIATLVALSLPTNSQIVATNTNILDQVIIDLKAKLYQKPNTDLYIYKSNLTNAIHAQLFNSHMHSNQINGSSLGKYFEISNKTNIVIASPFVASGATTSSSSYRQQICSDLKYCHKKIDNAQICLLNLNLILYMSAATTPTTTTTTTTNTLTQPHDTNKWQFNQIKLINLAIILNDLSGDYLHFEKTNYEFSVDVSLSITDEIILDGVVRAHSAKNSDLIKYYLNFKESNRQQMVDLVKIDEKSGQLSLNRTRLFVDGFYAQTIQFYVDALVQCSFSQKPIQNQTLVKINFLNRRHTQPTLNVTYLFETKTLHLGPKCLKLKQNDLRRSADENANDEIALVQIQIENLFDYDLDYSTLNFQIDSMQPIEVPNLTLKHLIDNIYVIYMHKSSEHFVDSLFLNEIYRINLKFTYSESVVVVGDVYMCVSTVFETSFPDELNLIQFDSSLVKLNTAVLKNREIEMKANKIGPFKSRIKYFLDTDYDNMSFKLEQLENDIVRFIIDQSGPNEPEVLSRETILVAYDEIRFPDFQKQYKIVKNMAIKHTRFLHFATKIRLNYDNEFLVSDMSIERINDERPRANVEIYKFSTIFKNLINNSIVGYLPHVNELDLNAFFTSHSIDAEYVIVSSNVDIDCFQIRKYDGIVYYTEQLVIKKPTCLTSQYPIKLEIGLANVATSKRIHIFLYDKVNSMKPVNIVYDDSLAENKLIPMNLNFEINLNYLGNFDYNLEKKMNLANLIPQNLRSNCSRIQFSLENTNTDMFALDSKRSSVYIRKDAIIRQNRINNVFLDGSRCFGLDIVANEYLYKSSIWRKRVATSNLKLNLCFYLSKNSNQTNSFLIPIELNALSSFEMLIKSRALTNYVPMVWYFTLAVFTFILTILVLFLFYNACLVTPSGAKQGENNIEHSNVETNYENFETKSSLGSKYSSTSSSYYDNENNDYMSGESERRRNQLQIRSDHPSIKTGASLGDDLDKIAENYGAFVHFSDERQVPSRLDILLNKQPLQSRIEIINHHNGELSSIKGEIDEEILSGDHGVYCLATATGTSFTSNISSVTNSQCVDAEVNGYLNLKELESPTGHNKTRLSLFDLTPTPLKADSLNRVNSRLGYNFDYTEIKQIFNGECII